MKTDMVCLLTLTGGGRWMNGDGGWKMCCVVGIGMFEWSGVVYRTQTSCAR